MRSDPASTALLDIQHHIDLALRFVEGFDRAKFQDDTIVNRQGAIMTKFHTTWVGGSQMSRMCEPLSIAVIAADLAVAPVEVRAVMLARFLMPSRPPARTRRHAERVLEDRLNRYRPRS